MWVSALRGIWVNSMTRLVLMFFLLPLSILPVQGAESAPAPAATEAEAANTPVTPEDIDAALAEEIRVAEEAAANAPAADSNEPFIPTVQISEDLSVSFPVDI